MFVGVLYDTVAAASSQTVCVRRADPQTPPQECPPATGERTNQLQDNDRVSKTWLLIMCMRSFATVQALTKPNKS